MAYSYSAYSHTANPQTRILHTELLAYSAYCVLHTWHTCISVC